MKMLQVAQKVLLYMSASHLAYENTGLEFHAGRAKAYEHVFGMFMKVTQGLTDECSQELALLCQFPLPESDYKNCLSMNRQDRQSEHHQDLGAQNQEAQIQ